MTDEEEEVHVGERYATSPLTGKTYRVTKWIEKEDGRIIALEQETIEEAIRDDDS